MSRHEIDKEEDFKKLPWDWSKKYFIVYYFIVIFLLILLYFIWKYVYMKWLFQEYEIIRYITWFLN